MAPAAGGAALKNGQILHEKMTETLSKTAFAKEAGVARSRVSQWIDAGLPVRPDGKIERSSAFQWIAQNIDHGRRNRWRGEEHPDSPSLADARRRREELRVQRERLSLEKERGELIPKAAVKSFLEARGVFDRDAHLAWVARTAARISSEFDVDATKLHALLEREMRAHLLELSETPLPEQERLIDDAAA